MKVINKTARQLLVFILIGFSVLLGITAFASAAEYEYTELLPPGWFAATDITYGHGGLHHIINDNGVVVGSGYKNGPTDQSKGFIYSEGEYSELLPPGWEGAIANGINNRGDVVGTGSNAKGERRGFIYKEGIYTELLPLGWVDAEVGGINDKGVVIGRGIKNYTDDDLPKGFVYRNGVYMTMRSPVLPPTVHLDSINDINDYGTIVGTCSYGVPAWGVPGKTYGLVYRTGIYKWLLPKGSEYAEAAAINNRGEVVGWVGYCKGYIYRWGVYTWLMVPGWSCTMPRDINNRGEVVGYSGDLNGHSKGFVYSRGTYSELLPPGWISAEAIAINNKGVVLGAGTDGNQINKMFIAEPKSN
jgi:probable HAF family extracellular repeat protein